jgi:hypothetical protein
LLDRFIEFQRSGCGKVYSGIVPERPKCESRSALCVTRPERRPRTFVQSRVQRRRKVMIAANKAMILGAILAFSAGSANAGPCNTASRDAGSGNVPGYTGQTTGSTAADSKQHPPTTAMNKASDGAATSSEDAQRQMQGHPTAAEQSRQTQPAPSEQSQKRTAGTTERSQPAPSEQSAKMSAGAAQPAPSEKKTAEGC